MSGKPRIEQVVRTARLGAGLAAVMAVAAAGLAQGPQPEHFIANAFSTGGVLVGGASAPVGAKRVDIFIDRLSTDQERASLVEAIRSGGNGALYDALTDLEPVGRVQVQGQLAHDLRFAREAAGADGERVLVLATERYLTFREVNRLTESRDYDISVMELVLGEDGKGSGAAMVAAQVTFDESTGQIALENLGSAPVQLKNVRPAKKKK